MPTFAIKAWGVCGFLDNVKNLENLVHSLTLEYKNPHA